MVYHTFHRLRYIGHLKQEDMATHVIYKFEYALLAWDCQVQGQDDSKGYTRSSDWSFST